MASAPTILSAKQSFLTSQTLILAQDVQPSRAWIRQNALTAESAANDFLPSAAVDEALARLSHTLQQHTRRVYAPQATRHVAEQIDRLYWDAADRRLDLAGGSEESHEGGISTDADLTDETAISNLSPKWLSDADTNEYPMEARRYTDLVSRLSRLSSDRRSVLDRLIRLRQLTSLLAPFLPVDPDSDESAGAGVQENLVSRNGKIEQELERMRVLLARVGGRISQLPSPTDGTGLSGATTTATVTAHESMHTTESARVDGLLASF